MLPKVELEPARNGAAISLSVNEASTAVTRGTGVRRPDGSGGALKSRLKPRRRKERAELEAVSEDLFGTAADGSGVALRPAVTGCSNEPEADNGDPFHRVPVLLIFWIPPG